MILTVQHQEPDFFFIFVTTKPLRVQSVYGNCRRVGKIGKLWEYFQSYPLYFRRMHRVVPARKECPCSFKVENPGGRGKGCLQDSWHMHQAKWTRRWTEKDNPQISVSDGKTGEVLPHIINVSRQSIIAILLWPIPDPQSSSLPPPRRSYLSVSRYPVSQGQGFVICAALAVVLIDNILRNSLVGPCKG